MRIVSICFTVLLLAFMLISVYEVFVIPQEWASPLIPESIVKSMQLSYIIYAIFNFVFFIPALYISVKGRGLAGPKVLAILVGSYIASFFVLSYIVVNG